MTVVVALHRDRRMQRGILKGVAEQLLDEFGEVQTRHGDGAGGKLEL